MSGWTQPICGVCWPAWELAGGQVPRVPTVVVDADEELCVACRNPTDDGIFVRVDPAVYKPWHQACDEQDAERRAGG